MNPTAEAVRTPDTGSDSGQSAPRRPSHRVSVIIPVQEIADYAREAVAALLHLAPDCEIIVVPDHDDGRLLPGARIVPSWPLHAPGDKRDLASKHATGQILAFLDDDAYPSETWLSSALRHFSDPSVAAVGGPGVTPPTNDYRQRASGWILASPAGSGAHTYRFRPGRARDVDDFPSMNLLVRKDVFEAVGGFKTQYWPGEDTELCRKLVDQGKRIVYEPSAVVYHHRRPVLVAHVRQQARYGLHRGHFARRFRGNSRKLGYAVPALFTLGLVTGPILGAISSVALVAYVLCVICYGAILGLTGAWVWRHEHDIRVALLTMIGLAVTHIVYGLAYIRGLLTSNLSH